VKTEQENHAFRCIAGLESYSGTITAHLTPLKNHLGFLMTDPFFSPRLPEKSTSGCFVMRAAKPIWKLTAKTFSTYRCTNTLPRTLPE
jgi:hypothetical protein